MGAGGAVDIDEGAVVLLATVEGVAPLPVADEVCAVADVAPGGGAELALVKHGAGVAAAAGAGGGLKHPVVGAAGLEAAHEVVRGAVGDGVEGALDLRVVPSR